MSWWPGDGTADDIIDGNDGVLNGATFTPGIVGQAFAVQQTQTMTIEIDGETKPALVADWLTRAVYA